MGLVLFLLGPVLALSAAEVGTLRDHIFERLTDAREYLEDGDPAEARRITERLLTFQNTPYEQATIEQALGFICLEMEDYPSAIASFERAIDARQLPAAAVQPMLYNLAQLYHQQEQWAESLQALEKWLENEPEPGVDAFLIGANASIQLKAYEQAIQYVRKAIERAPQPVESHYQLWLGALIQLESWPRAAALLQVMIEQFPGNSDYWIQLTSAYLQMEDFAAATGALRIAAWTGNLQKPAGANLLVSLLTGQSTPHKAAAWLQESIENGILDPSYDVWSKLGDLWLMAREYEAARTAFTAALAIQDDFSLRYRLAQLYFSEEQFAAVVEQLASVSDHEDHRHFARGMLLLGIALVETEQTERAMEVFTRLESEEVVTEQARMWLDFLSDRDPE